MFHLHHNQQAIGTLKFKVSKTIYRHYKIKIIIFISREQYIAVSYLVLLNIQCWIQCCHCRDGLWCHPQNERVPFQWPMFELPNLLLCPYRQTLVWFLREWFRSLRQLMYHHNSLIGKMHQRPFGRSPSRCRAKTRSPCHNTSLLLFWQVLDNLLEHKEINFHMILLYDNNI